MAHENLSGGHAMMNFTIKTDFIVLISGASGSGKTFLSNVLSSYLECSIINLDRFFLDASDAPEEIFESGRKAIQWESPKAIDMDLCLNCVKELIFNGKTNIPIYSFELSKRVGFEVIERTNNVLVIEGLHAFLFNDFVKNLGFKCFKIFIDIDLDFREKIIEIRDAEIRGKSGNFQERISVIKIGEKKWILPQKDDADLVLHRNQPHL